jgi:acyl-coenzyme A thioesterase 13
MSGIEASIPAGFGPLFRTSPLLEALGPFYGKGTGPDLVIGLRVAEKHTNTRGTVHGGVLATIGDIALGYTLASGPSPPKSAVTASLTVDYVGVAKIGDWIEAKVDRSKIGKTLAFANAYLTVNGAQIARVSGVFAVTT